MSERDDAVYRNERKLAAAARLAHLGYWEDDLLANRLSWSTEAGLMLGLPAHERERPWDEFKELVHPDDWPHLQDARARVRGGERGLRFGFRGKLPDGSYRHVDTMAEAITNARGDVIRVVGAIQDRFQHTCRGDDDAETRSMLLLGRFAAGIVHDFNHVLSSIIGFADLVALQLGPFDPLRSDVNEIQRAAGAAERLTSELLAFARGQTIMHALEMDPIIRSLRRVLERLLGDRITLILHLGATRPVIGNRSSIERVIVNLAVNARDAMPQGGYMVIETSEVTTHSTKAAQDGPPEACVLVTVSDTGVGMDEETRARIFDPSFTTKQLGSGGGLGLAIVHEIVEQSGGWIRIDSEPGRGSRFEVYLPTMRHQP